MRNDNKCLLVFLSFSVPYISLLRSDDYHQEERQGGYEALRSAPVGVSGG